MQPEQHNTAYNQRFNWAVTANFLEVEPGIYALFPHGGTGEALYIGPDLQAMVAAYRARPTYTPREPRKASSKAENTAKLLALLGARS